MDKRDFLKTGFVGALGLISLPSIARNKGSFFRVPKKFKIPDLPYTYDALEPYIDKQTMEIHHLKHHAGYTAKLNAALEKEGVSVETARDILREASTYSADLINNAGGFVNHNIFWKSLSANGGGQPTGEIATLIHRDFGSFESFKEQFSTAAKSQFGSGWAWLVFSEDKLKVVNTANQDNPIMDTLPETQKGRPLLCLDVWEHAYYLKYQNRRAEYVDAFWNIVNWELPNLKLSKITKA